MNEQYLQILNLIEKVYKVPAYLVFTKTNKYEYVLSRHIFRYYLNKISKDRLSHFQISNIPYENQCDRTTVIHSINTINNELRYNYKVQHLIKDIIRCEYEYMGSKMFDDKKSHYYFLSEMKKTLKL